MGRLESSQWGTPVRDAVLPTQGAFLPGMGLWLIVGDREAEGHTQQAKHASHGSSS
jgi:hypothetical protein